MYKIQSVKPFDAGKIRKFCLNQIKSEYGYSYNKDWHYDLDTLSDNSQMYYPKSKGAFYYISINNCVIGTLGLRNLKYKPSNFKLVKDIFNVDYAGSFWRTYTHISYRNKGIATNLVNKAEERAKKYGYKLIYLHSSHNKPNSVKFWKKRGYKVFKEEDNEDKTVHMAKVI